jgi:hypothetical protein
MKFNHEKWDRLLRRQQAMHKQYLQFGAEWEEAKQQESKTKAFFIEGYDQNLQAMQVVNQDKKLSAAELEQRIEAIKSNWADFTSEYRLQDGPNFQAALIRLYGDILTTQKLYERREQQSQIMAAYGASMGRLKEFAKRYIKTDGNALAPVNESNVGGYPGNYQNGGDYV